jgi:mRNA-degrading endonuclease RelE of RelBE toxin-antitoxin system
VEEVRLLRFEIRFSPHAREHINDLRKRDQQIIVKAISVHLQHQPDQPTRNRKPLTEKSFALWELRVGDFRVFYDVNPEQNQVVIVAVGKKRHNDLWIGNEKVEL